MELSSKQSTSWYYMFGTPIVALTIIFMGTAWKLTKPVLSRNTVIFIGMACILLFGFLLLAPALVFYGASFATITFFCALISNDFRDNNPNYLSLKDIHLWDFQRLENIHHVGLLMALALAAIVFYLSGTSVPLRMLLGAPAIIVCGFLFITALAFLPTALLSLISPVLVRLAWLIMIAVVFLSPLNHEPIRTIPPDPKIPSRRPPSQHFIEWLRNRPKILNSATPYPVFFVAAQGGGVRAAYWTSTLLAGFEEQFPGFTDHVYVISGVSGGSVGGTLFTSLYREIRAHGSMQCAPLEVGGRQGLRPCASYIFQWDLLGPPLSAFLLNDLPFGWYGVRRASYLEQGLETAWFASMNTRQFEENFQSLWHDRPYQVPSLILNTTSADDGHRIVVSNLLAKGEITTEPDVEELLGRPLRLSTATFLSARFPIISPVAVGTSAQYGDFRLVDGGYFNNSGMASISQLLRSVLPAVAKSEFAGRVQPYVLVISSSPVILKPSKGRFSGSLVGALLEPVSVLENTGEAHETTYLKEVEDLVGEKQVASDLRPPQGTTPVALGWMLSAETRCKMDNMVNKVLNESKGSAAIGLALGGHSVKPATWSSCRPNVPEKR